MTTELEPVKGYQRLDFYADLIIEQVAAAKDRVKEYMKSYFDTAREEGIPEEEAKKYLRSKIPNSTFYKYLPLEISKQEKSSSKKYSTVEYNQQEESSIEPVKDFNTKGMGVAITDDEPPEIHPQEEEKTQSIDCPAATDEQNDRLVARIQELEKMVSDLSFQKGADTLPPVPEPTAPPVQQKIRPFILKKDIIPTLIADLNHSLNNDVQMFLCEDSWLYWITGYQSTYSSERKRELAQNFEVLSQLNATS